MEELKSIFGEGSLNYEEFSQKLGEAGETIKLANLKSGGYVDKGKYDKAESQANEWKTKFEALTESTKDYEQLKTDYDSIKGEYEKLQGRVNESEKMSIISGANVNPKFAKFVYSEVSALSKDGKDFKECLDEYLKSNKEFLNQPKGTFVDLQNGGGQPKTNNQIMNDMIRKKGK